jgi:hypothetical protein
MSQMYPIPIEAKISGHMKAVPLGRPILPNRPETCSFEQIAVDDLSKFSEHLMDVTFASQKCMTLYKGDLE